MSLVPLLPPLPTRPSPTQPPATLQLASGSERRARAWAGPRTRDGARCPTPTAAIHPQPMGASRYSAQPQTPFCLLSFMFFFVKSQILSWWCNVEM